jgi:hypothetical protein
VLRRMEDSLGLFSDSKRSGLSDETPQRRSYMMAIAWLLNLNRYGTKTWRCKLEGCVVK